MGVLLDEMGKFPEAIAELEKGVELEPKSVAGWNSLGCCLDKMNRPKEAEGAFRKALELDPGDPISRSNLARVLMRQGSLEEALSEALDPKLKFFLYIITKAEH